MTEASQASETSEAYGKGRVGLFVFLVLFTLVVGALITIDAVSDDKADYPDQLDPTTLEDAPG